MPEKLISLTSNAPFDLFNLVLNLFVGVILALILRVHFRRYGTTLSNREEFSQVFPFILLTTILIISVVKSSLALSLGLVGALSIVRFRTPIKEPEELAYLFMAIAIGLGLGANQTIPTVVAGVIILGVMAALSKQKDKSSKGKNLYLSMEYSIQNDDNAGQYLTEFNDIFLEYTVSSDLRRYDVRDGLLEATYFIDIGKLNDLSDLMKIIRTKYTGINLCFIDQNKMPSI